jgi:hypothetical protein
MTDDLAVQMPFLEGPWEPVDQSAADAITELRLNTLSLAIERERLARARGERPDEAEQTERKEAQALAARWVNEEDR